MRNVHRLKVANGSQFLTIEEASAELGIKPSAIRNYLHADKLTTFKFKNLTLLSRNEVDSWKSRQRRR